MSEWTRTLLGILALFVYACLIGFKALDLSKLGKNAELSENQIRKAQQTLRFDMIRLAIDCILLTGFLFSKLFPRWVGLFRETALGGYTACLIPMSTTLLISVFTDWIPISMSNKQAGNEIPSFARHLLRQLTIFIKIMLKLMLVWIILFFLEPTEIHPLLQVAIAVGIHPLLRVLLQLAGKHKNKQT